MAIEFDEVVSDVSEVLSEISAATTEFEKKAGYHCRSGCGQCCLKPTIEAQVVEMLPLAQHLLETGMADEVYERAVTREDETCILYKFNDPERPDLGRCEFYQHRPSVCRLFGYAAINKKSGPPGLSTCKWHKQLFPKEVANAQQAIAEGESVPTFSQYTLKIHGLNPSSSWGNRLPINQALRIAIEKLSLVKQYQSEQTQVIELPLANDFVDPSLLVPALSVTAELGLIEPAVAVNADVIFEG